MGAYTWNARHLELNDVTERKMRLKGAWKSGGKNTHTTGLGEHHITKTEQTEYYGVSAENE